MVYRAKRSPRSHADELLVGLGVVGVVDVEDELPGPLVVHALTDGKQGGSDAYGPFKDVSPSNGRVWSRNAQRFPTVRHGPEQAEPRIEPAALVTGGMDIAAAVAAAGLLADDET